jgi:hypothetical protein
VLHKKTDFHSEIILTCTGISIIILVFLYSYGVFFDSSNLAGYNIADVHRYTARAMMEGKLYFPSHFRLGETLDLQFYNGAFFTNWGYGIPLLQLPFYWLDNLFNSSGEYRYFPDRLIFIFYFIISLIIFYAGLRKLFYKVLEIKNPFLVHTALVFINLFFYTTGFFSLCSLTIRVYEETMCYFLMLQFATTGFFLYFYSTGGKLWVAGAAFTSFLSVLIRPTALIYFLFWCILFIFNPGNTTGRKRWKTALLFILVSLPLSFFWMTTNYYKSGELISVGINNAHSYNIEEVANIRFGDSLNPKKWLSNAARLYAALFTGNTNALHLPPGNIRDMVGDPAKTPYYRTLVIEEQGNFSVPFLGPLYPVVLLAIFIYFLIYHRKKWYFYIPFAALVFMFIGLVYASFTTTKFAFRYTADFQPALILIFLFLIISLKSFLPGLTDQSRKIFFAVIMLFPIISICEMFVSHIYPQAKNSIAKSEAEAPDYLTKDFMENLFQKIAQNWGNFNAPDFPQCRNNYDPLTGMMHDRLYWDNEGRIKLISNFFIGVKPKTSKEYQLVLKTEGVFNRIPVVYINNRYYKMKQDADSFSVKFVLDYKKLITPNLLITVKWGLPDDDYSDRRLISACLQ